MAAELHSNHIASPYEFFDLTEWHMYVVGLQPLDITHVADVIPRAFEAVVTLTGAKGILYVRLVTMSAVHYVCFEELAFTNQRRFIAHLSCCFFWNAWRAAMVYEEVAVLFIHLRFAPFPLRARQSSFELHPDEILWSLLLVQVDLLG
jgi:hypothetical protein